METSGPALYYFHFKVTITYFFIINETGLLIFRVVAEPRNLGKSAKSREIHKDTKNTSKFIEILSNTCLYNILETYFSYWIYLLAVNLQIYLRTLSLKRANNIPKLPGVDYVAKNWALAISVQRKYCPIARG